MQRNKYLRYWKSGSLFLAGYFGSQIFGVTLWHFAVISVLNWWHRGVVADTVVGFVGLALFLWFKEHHSRERSGTMVSRKSVKQEPV